MQLGIFAKTFAGTLPQQVLEQVQQAGFSCAQYNMACSGLAAMPDAIEGYQARAVAAAGVKIAAVSGTYNMIHPDVTVRQTGLRRLEVLAANCSLMGTNIITLCTGTRDSEDQWRAHVDNNSAEAWADLCENLSAALAIAERHNVILGIEPELANVVNSAAKAKQIIADMQSGRLKIILDAANLFEHETIDEQRKIVAGSIDLLAEHIVMAHAKDRLPSGEFVAAGQGCLDYPFYMTELRKAGFAGPLITHGLQASEAPHVAQFLKSILEG
jgi:sugar phosphate isomerase/epimerase